MVRIVCVLKLWISLSVEASPPRHFPRRSCMPLYCTALYWSDLPWPMLSATFTDSASDFVPPVLAQGLCTIPRFDPDKKIAAAAITRAVAWLQYRGNCSVGSFSFTLTTILRTTTCVSRLCFTRQLLMFLSVWFWVVWTHIISLFYPIFDSLFNRIKRPMLFTIFESLSCVPQNKQVLNLTKLKEFKNIFNAIAEWVLLEIVWWTMSKMNARQCTVHN